MAEKQRQLAEKQRQLAEKQMRKGSITEFIKGALDPIHRDLIHNLARLKNKFFYKCWSYKTDSKELESDIKSVSVAKLQRFSGEKRIKAIINQIEDYNSAILIFEGQLTNIIEKCRTPFGITPEELLAQTTDELKECKWRYVQWIVGKNIGAPEDSLKEFSEKFIFRPLQRLEKTELELFEGKVKSQEELERIKDDRLIPLEDANNFEIISKRLKSKTDKLREDIKSAMDDYQWEYGITDSELDKYELPKKPDISVEI